MKNAVNLSKSDIIIRFIFLPHWQQLTSRSQLTHLISLYGVLYTYIYTGVKHSRNTNKSLQMGSIFLSPHWAAIAAANTSKFHKVERYRHYLQTCLAAISAFLPIQMFDSTVQFVWPILILCAICMYQTNPIPFRIMYLYVVYTHIIYILFRFERLIKCRTVLP